MKHMICKTGLIMSRREQLLKHKSVGAQPGWPSVRGAERADIYMRCSVDQRASGGPFSVETLLPWEITDCTL